MLISSIPSLGLPSGSIADRRGDSARKAADAKLREAKAALSQLEQSRKSNGAKEAQKAAAQEKLQRLKQQLMNLMMMGGDPKVLARQIAKIMKEIGQAAKAYAAAGGKDGGVPISPQPSAAASAQSPTETSASDQQSAADAQPPGQQPNEEAEEDKAEPAVPNRFSVAFKPHDPFLQDAKALAKAARRLLEQEIRKARQRDDDQELDQLERTGRRAMAEIDDSERDFARMTGAGTLYAPTPVVESPPPMVSVTA